MPSYETSERRGLVEKKIYASKRLIRLNFGEGGCLHEVNNKAQNTAPPQRKKERTQQAGTPHISQSSGV